MHKIL